MKYVDITVIACLSAYARVFPLLLIIILCQFLHAVKINEPLDINLNKSYTCVLSNCFVGGLTHTIQPKI